MASSTPNLDLTLPVGGENVSRQIINANNVKIDEAVGAVPSGTDLQSQVTALNNNLTSMRYNVLTSGSLKTWAVNTSEGFTCFRYNNSVTDTPCEYGHGYIVHYGQNIRIVVFNMTGDQQYTAYSSNSGSSWSSWQELATKQNTTYTQLAYTTKIPSSATTYNLSESFMNFNFLLVEIMQYDNVWLSCLVTTAYFNNTTSSSRIVLKYSLNTSTLGVFQVYKASNTQFIVVGTGSDFDTDAYHVRISGCFRK